MSNKNTIDENLIEGILNKKHGAFTIFYNKIVNNFFSYLKSNFFLKNYEINDIISDTFMKIRHNLDNFDKKKGNFITWIWVILRNTTKDYFKKKKEKYFTDFESEFNDGNKISIEEFVEDKTNILEDIEEDYKFEEIKNAIGILKSQEKEILFLRFTQQLSFKEISQITGIEEINIRVNLHRTIKKLKKNLKKM